MPARGLARGQIGQNSVGSKGIRSLVTSFARFCSTPSDLPTPQAMANLISVCSFAGPANAQMHRHLDPRRGQPLGPGHDAARLEGELRGDGEGRVGAVGEILFPFSAAMTSASPPSGSMSRLPSGWPATCRWVKPASSKKPLSRSCMENGIRRAAWRCRRRAEGPASRPPPPGSGGSSRQASRARGWSAPGNAASARSLRRAGAWRSDHVVDLGPVDMGDVDARAGGQERAEILDLLGGARHHLDRVILEQGREYRHGRGDAAAGRPGLRKDKRAMRISRNVAKSGPVQSALAPRGRTRRRRSGSSACPRRRRRRAARPRRWRCRRARPLARRSRPGAIRADRRPRRGRRCFMATRSMACSNRSGRGAFAPRRPLPTMTWAGMSLQ
jgi:hypothetical protein